jgi:type I restriction enzyme, S subunit
MTSAATWKTYKLGDLARYVNGMAFKPDDWKKSGLPIVRIQNLTDRSKPFNYCDQPVDARYLINDGDLLISWSATLGSFIWDRGPAVLNQHIFKAVPNTEIVERDFLHFLMLETLDEMASLSHGIAMKHITKGKFEAIEVAVPTLHEQRSIVARIKACMERVEEIETLRSASLGEQQYLSSSLIESELHAHLASEKEWPTRTVGEIVTSLRNGRSISQDTEGRADGAVLTLTAVRSISLGVENQKAIVLSEGIANQFGIDEGDVFVSRANTIELVGLSAVAMEKPANRLIYPDLLIKLKVDHTQLHPRYLAYALRSASARQQIKARALGSSQTMVKISGERLREVSIPVPSLSEQEQILGQLDMAHDLMRQLAAESLSREVEALRSSILRKAFAGEL